MKLYCIAFLVAAGLAAPSVGLAADGAAVWKAQKCHKCHGDTGKADSKMGQKKGIRDMTTAEWQKAITDTMIRDAITKGIDRERDGKKEKMKPAKDIKADEVDALLKLIRSWAAG